MSQPEQHGDDAPPKGMLAWFTHNHVAANLLMAVLIGGGLILLPQIKREVFPEFELDLVSVTIPYPGASPEEVESGVLLSAEEAVRGIDGIKEVRSTALEGSGTMQIELLRGTDRDRALADVKSAIDRITSFPADAERPIIALVVNRQSVLSVVLYGDVDEKTLRALAEHTRQGLIAHDGISQVELSAARALEISIEVTQDTLRRYNLTIEQIAQAVRAAAVEMPGGGVKTSKGEVLVRMAERRDLGIEFEDIVVLSQADGSQVRLGELATIKDSFAETDQETRFNGKRAQRIEVFRVGDEGPIDVSAAVSDYIEQHEHELPAGVQLAIWDDRSEMYAARQDLLMRNSSLGLLLVIFVLGLFLHVRLAFWVTLGIPISFIGALLFLPTLNVSINMISLFAFIVTLGMVVDDAIIVGEAIYTQRRKGLSAMQAAIAGVKEVAQPVTFSILTTIIAFLPLLFVPGFAGNFFRNIPLVVITVLAMSLVESLLVLPAHLTESKDFPTRALFFAASLPFRLLDMPVRGLFGFSLLTVVERWQQRFSRGIEWFIEHVYRGQLRAALRYRYLTLSMCLSMFMLTLAFVFSGRMAFTFLPKIDGDVIRATIEMPVGTPVEVTREHLDEMLSALDAVIEDHGGHEGISRGVISDLGGVMGTGESHLADVMVFLVPSDERSVTSSVFAKAWRERLGEIPGAKRVAFNYSTGTSGGAPVHVRLSHPDANTLDTAARKLASIIGDYAGTYDINDGSARGKEQIDLKLTPEARSLGLTQAEVGRQLRSAFFGAEALRQQRGREEIRVFVRRPLHERRSEYDLENMLIRTPEGGEMPLGQAAEVSRGRAYTAINRAQGRRVLDVTAEVDATAGGNGMQIVAGLKSDALPELMKEFPGLSYEPQGQEQARAEMLAGLGQNFVVALIAMCVLLAVAFRSYVQWLIVVLAIPMGIVGAAIGHAVMGYELSLMTMFGVVALSGVVVNDSLVLVDAVNRYRAEGMTLTEAVLAGGQRRFRPILLTSLTTFLGLMPMILETSVQARFLIPMAISLGFGVIFATAITLLMVPAMYLAIEDLLGLSQRAGRGLQRLLEPTATEAPRAE